MQISKATTSVEGAIKLRCRNCLSTELARLDDAETAEALDSKVYSKSVGRGGGVAERNSASTVWKTEALSHRPI